MNDNKLYTSEPLRIEYFTEYSKYKEVIPVYAISNDMIVEGNVFDYVVLAPHTHTTNIWHLLHHLFITYKFMIQHALTSSRMFPIIMKSFPRNTIVHGIYNELLYKGMGFNYEEMIKLYTIFDSNKCIEVNKLIIADSTISFKHEPLFPDFTAFIMRNLNVEYAKTDISGKRITFILRTGVRVIKNLDIVKKGLSDVDIRYVFLENHSIREQLEIIANSDILIGVHGAGLTWCVFMKPNSLLIEMYPGDYNTTNYSNWCALANIRYKRMGVDMKDVCGKEFRNFNVELSDAHIHTLKQNLTPS